MKTEQEQQAEIKKLLSAEKKSIAAWSEWFDANRKWRDQADERLKKEQGESK